MNNAPKHMCPRMQEEKLGSCFTKGNVHICEESPNYRARMKILFCCVHL